MNHSGACGRDKFDIVLGKCIALGSTIQTKCSKGPVDVDNAGMRLTLDVVSKVSACASIPNSCTPMPDVSHDQARHTLVKRQAAFNYDTKAVEVEDNRIIAALPCALKELQKRMTNPFHVLLVTEVRWWTQSKCSAALQGPLVSADLAQASRKAMRCAKEFRAVCEDILMSMRTSDLSGRGSQSVGSELLKIRDPTTGRGTLMATCNPCGVLKALQ